ncbi:hypothetical protein [Limnobacter alexandrii]|jgi:hypothetical protein|nr:hypothetical protein [Limnobacter alexandrii]
MPVMRSNCGFPYTQKPQHEPFWGKFQSKNAGKKTWQIDEDLADE